jgi:CRISPR-associated protein Cas2
MMIISLTSVNQQLRGYLSRFLIEINTGLYVGNVSARVRDYLCDRVTDNIGIGKAVLAWNTDNEQGFALKIIGYSDREVVNNEGIFLIRHINNDYNTEQPSSRHWSKAYQRRRFGL